MKIVIDPAVLDQRAALAADSVPALPFHTWVRLQCQRPASIDLDVWRRAINDAGRFLDALGVDAVSMQWVPANSSTCRAAARRAVWCGGCRERRSNNLVPSVRSSATGERCSERRMENNSASIYTSAKRTRDWRRRKRAGAVMVTLEVSPEGLRLLQSQGWLACDRADDPSAVAESVLWVAGAALLRGLRA